MMNIIVLLIPIVVKIPVIYTTIMITGIIVEEYVKSLNFDVVLEECLFVYLILGYAMDE